MLDPTRHRFRVSASFAAVLLSGGAAAACASHAGSSDDVTFAAQPYARVATPQLALEMRTAPEQPPSRGRASIELRAFDEARSEPRDGMDMRATLWMPAHGHGSHVTPKITPLGGGAYRVDDVLFTMPGAWELLVDFADPKAPSAPLQHATFHVEVR